MTDASNIVAHQCATELHRRRANILRQVLMDSINVRLKVLRERTGLTVRDVARYLEFETHSRYSYYESPRFTAKSINIALARKLAGLFSQFGVPAEEVLQLAGLNDEEAIAEAENAQYEPERKVRLFMEVSLPNEASLTRMFDAMLQTAGQDDPSGELARTLALLLPSALAGTTGEFAGESLDPEFRPRSAARSQRQTKERQRPQQ